MHGAHELFEAQAARTPGRIAAVFESECLSYQALDVRATALAGRLQALGVSSGSLVGIYLDRSLEMLMSVLAVLKAGGAYVPLDPSYPAELLEFMIEDAQVDLILGDGDLASRLGRIDRRIVTIRDVLATGSENELAPRGKARAEDVAYVIYTSGSTGKPKGVEITTGQPGEFSLCHAAGTRLRTDGHGFGSDHALL